MNDSPQPATRARRRWLRRVLVTLGVVVAVLATLACWLLFFFPDNLARRTAETRAQRLGFYLKIGHLEVEPLAASVDVRDMELDAWSNHQAGLPPLLTLDHYAVEVSLGEVLRQERLHVRELEVEAPRLHVEWRDGVFNVDRLLEALDQAMASLGVEAAPTPEPTAAPTDLRERLRAETAGLKESLSGLPLPVVVDRAHTSGAGLTVVEEGKQIVSVQGLGATTALSLATDGTGDISVQVDPSDRITFAVAVPDLEARGELIPKASVALTLWEKGRFEGTLRVAPTRVTTPSVTDTATATAQGTGSFDLGSGDIQLSGLKLVAGDYFDMGADFTAAELGTESMTAHYALNVHGDRVPKWVVDYLQTALEADQVSPGLHIEGTMTGRVASADPNVLLAQWKNKRLPLTATIQATGRTDDPMLRMSGVTLGGLGFESTIDVSPETVDLGARVQIATVAHELLGSRPIGVQVDNQLTLTGLEDLHVGKLVARIPSRGLRFGAGGDIGGFVSALGAYLDASDAGAVEEVSAMAALETTRDVNLAANMSFRSAKPIELVPDVKASGGFVASGTVRRRGKPATRLTGSVGYSDFGVSVGSDIEVEGLEGQLELAKTLLLGGPGTRKIAEQRPDMLDELEEALAEFDPAERGYYTRLAPYRINRENVKARRIRFENYIIEDLVADVSYDGEAIRTSYFRMNLLGGETVGRAYFRPEADGIRSAFFANFAGVDVAPILREKPPETAGDASRVNGSMAASMFLPAADPASGISDAHARMDLTAAGSEVVNEILLFLDPEQQDPVYNWARNTTRQVKGLGRPELSVVLDKGFYDVTIGFPSMGVSKEVRRIPLGQTLALKFSRDLLEEYLPDEETLKLASAIGMDRNAEWIYLE